ESGRAVPSSECRTNYRGRRRPPGRSSRGSMYSFVDADRARRRLTPYAVRNHPRDVEVDHRLKGAASGLMDGAALVCIVVSPILQARPLPERAKRAIWEGRSARSAERGWASTPSSSGHHVAADLREARIRNYLPDFQTILRKADPAYGEKILREAMDN